MLDHMKTLKQGGENGRQPRPQWPGCFCKKKCRSNTCKKLHFVQKIHPAPKVIPKKDEKTKRTKNGLVDHG